MKIPAVRFEHIRGQGKSGTIYTFAAPSFAIDNIAGIPRKEVTDATIGETVGYQRPEVDRKLPKFLENEANIIPTALLLATRKSSALKFTPTSDSNEGANACQGVLEIEVDVSETDSLTSLLDKLLEALRQRPFEHAGLTADSALVKKALATLSAPSPIVLAESAASDTDDDDVEEPPDETASDVAEAVYSQDAHVERFYVAALSARRALDENVALETKDSVLGFSKAMLLDYLRPTIIVDGQHRLLGAIKSLESKWKSYLQNSDEIAQEIGKGKSEAELRGSYYDKHDRWFPVCLLATDDFAEHVFHFVVVNQKAKSINKALLSSIISTSLTAEELEEVKPRLGDASIPIEDLAIVGRLRHSGPFAGFVMAGFDPKTALRDHEKLEQTSLIRLFKLFKDLKNARDPNSGAEGEDVVYPWRSEFLKVYEPVQDFRLKGFGSRLQAWSDANGPWAEIFTAFFQSVREHLSSEGSRLAVWGNVRESQLYNFATLGILSIQFFHFLHDREIYPKTSKEFRVNINEFVTKRLNREFFTTEWNLEVGRRIEQVNLNKVHRYVRLLWKTNKGQMKPNLQDFFKT